MPKKQQNHKLILSLFVLFVLGIAAENSLHAQTCVPAPSPVKNPAEVRLSGDWEIEVTYQGKIAFFDILPPETVTVSNEKYDHLEIFKPDGPSWRRGTVLTPLNAQECSVENAVVPGTISIALEENGEPLIENADYIADTQNSNIGRIEGGKLGSETEVFVSYQYVPMRIDSVIQTPNHKMNLLVGVPDAANPVPPALKEGEIRLANIYLSGRMEKLTENNLFPILDNGKLILPADAVAERLLPKTWKKLVSGEPIRILAWGDSVTECGFLPDEKRWQAQFVDRLQKRFPNAKIELITEGWGGRNTDSFFAEPAGSPHNYKEKVLDINPDLVVSEFVNDAGLPLERLADNYNKIYNDLNKIGAEWIILSPHYIRPSWMGIDRQKEIDNDPRPYTAFIRQFSSEKNVALADGALLYGRLWRQGIPYMTLMKNNINHPNEVGMAIFADALLALFGRE